jgi:predicted nucleic acid-binding protein
MKVFFDTNIILEYMMRREQFDAAKQVINGLVNDNHALYMSAGGFYSILYIVDKYLNKELHMDKETRVAFMRNMAHGLLKDFQVASHDNESLLCGVDDLRFTDLEDSCQLQAAISAGCQYLLTFNVKDYPSSES